jgi:putative ubiquitin-RnfH superfamily antitoxin RatB of RatAB toxin-antitoxin module
MQAQAKDTKFKVTVAYASAPTESWLKTVYLTQPSTVAEAIALSGFEQTFPTINWQAAGVGLFGRNCSPEEQVMAGARIEIYRPLTFDPMQSRRRRAAHRKAQALAKKKPRVKHKRHDHVKTDPTAKQPTEKSHG